MAKQGERVRIFFGNAGPNLISSFHVIGAIFDKVYREGDVISPPARGIAVTAVPSAGTTVVEFDALVPGSYTLVDHVSVCAQSIDRSSSFPLGCSADGHIPPFLAWLSQFSG